MAKKNKHKEEEEEFDLPSVQTIDHYMKAREVLENVEARIKSTMRGIKENTTPEQTKEKLQKLLEYVEKSKEELRSPDIAEILSDEDDGSMVPLMDFLSSK